MIKVGQLFFLLVTCVIGMTGCFSKAVQPGSNLSAMTAITELALMDKLENWNKVFLHTSNWELINANNGGAKVTATSKESIVYQVRNIRNFKAEIHSNISVNECVKVFASNDYKTWAEIQITYTEHVLENGLKKTICSPNEETTTGINYLKIEFTLKDDKYMLQLSKIEIFNALPITNGLKLWLDADAIPVQGDLTPLASSWNDCSGNDNHAAFEKAPLYVETAANGRPAVRFDGEGQYLRINNIRLKDKATVFMVFANQHVVLRKDKSDTLLAIKPKQETAKILSSRSSAKVSHYPAYYAEGGENSCFINGRNEEVAGNEIFKERFYIGTTIFKSLPQSTEIFIGSETEASGFGKNDIAEVLVYDRMLREDEKHEVERWLGEKYGISVQYLPLNHPVETYNHIMGVQSIGDQYSFGEAGTRVLDAARLIYKMGSRVMKISLSDKYVKQNGVPQNSNVNSLVTLAREEPSIKAVLDMPFTDYLFWVNSFARPEWQDGLTKDEADLEYREVYDLTAHLLTQYNDTGKTFYIGNWEGDWMLFGQGKNNLNKPLPPEKVQGMIDWANTRQKAIDDAKAATPHKNVNVYYYVEMNQAILAIENKPCVTNSVIPYMDKLDFISFSSYTVKFSDQQTVSRVLDHLQSKLKPDPSIKGSRIIIGEYGYQWNGTETMEEFKNKHRDMALKYLNWPYSSPRFILVWQFFNAEKKENGQPKEMCLIDEKNTIRPLYTMHETHLEKMKKFVGDFYIQHERVPSEEEYKQKAIEVLSGL